MKANEFRLGNWVSFYGKRNLPITGISIKTVRHKNIICCVSELEPITLTEELLVRCGFKEVFEHVNHGTLKSFELQLSSDSIIISQFRPEEEGLLWVSITDCDHDGCVLTGIDKLHQLQNIHFALTGEELYLKI